jgi:hypothetical protein
MARMRGAGETTSSQGFRVQLLEGYPGQQEVARTRPRRGRWLPGVLERPVGIGTHCPLAGSSAGVA